MIIAKEVNMVPDELIGNLGDTHLYSNHIEQANEQFGKELSLQERSDIAGTNHFEIGNSIKMIVGVDEDHSLHEHLDNLNIPRKTREPFPLPTVKLNHSGSIIENIDNVDFSDFILENYQSHGVIKAPLSN